MGLFWAGVELVSMLLKKLCRLSTLDEEASLGRVGPVWKRALMEEMSKGAVLVEVDEVSTLMLLDEEELLWEDDELVVVAVEVVVVCLGVAAVKFGSTFIIRIFSSLPTLSDALTDRMYCPGTTGPIGETV
jgi:hypothetical protein